MSEKKAIRGAVFGGFNKKDVSGYIEELARKSAQYQSENDELRERCEQLEDFRSSHEAMLSELAALRAENSRLTEENASLSAELSRARESIDAFDFAKERLANLELEASRRALELEREAKTNAAGILAEAGNCITELQASLDSISSAALQLKYDFARQVSSVESRLDDIVAFGRDKKEFLGDLTRGSN